MDKKLFGLAAAAAVLVPAGAAQAMAPGATTMQASSFAELLAPIPNAADKLQASDEVLRERDANAAKVEMAQYYYHHHHHHHFFHRRFFHHHHHHHFYRRHFHHHHHHHFYY